MYIATLLCEECSQYYLPVWRINECITGVITVYVELLAS